MNSAQPNTTITTLDLLRHGECQGGEIYRGTTDVALAERGWQQMEASLNSLGAAGLNDWDRVISSPLMRCREFAQAKANSLGIALSVHEDLRELSFGDWEGREIAEVHRTEATAVTAFYGDPASVAPPNGETMQVVQGRLQRALDEILAAHAGEHLLLVQHGGTIRIMLASLLQMPLSAVTRLDLHYASLSRVRLFKTDTGFFPKLVFLNKTGPSVQTTSAPGPILGQQASA